MRYPRSLDWTLNGLNLNLMAGEQLALVGSSGCGKSTIAKTILHLLPAGSVCTGTLLLAGQDPRQLNHFELNKFRGESVGLVFQDPMTRLNPLLTIGDHLFDTLKAHRPELEHSWYQHRAKELLEKVGINPKRITSFPHELSGGMRQRVAIALAIALKPTLIIADEPTTSLDQAVSNQIMSELRSLCDELGSALLLISHDLVMASKWCERMAIIDNGRVIEEGLSRDLIKNPKSSIGKRLVNAAREKEICKTISNTNSSLVLDVKRLRCWHPSAGWPWQNKWLKAVDEVSFSLCAGESLGVVGLSGCGKSTLCRALVGLNPIRGGEVQLLGRNLLALKGKSLKRARQSIQMVFQDPLACLNPKMNVGDAIADPLLIHDLSNKKAAREKARFLLQQVGLSPPEQYQNRLPKELSGGQQQRVAIARAIASNPKVLICDESVSMLDAEIQSDILNLLTSLQNDLGLAILFITHDLSLATSFCHKVMVLDEGKIVEEGFGKKILEAPQALITRQLVDAFYRIN